MADHHAEKAVLPPWQQELKQACWDVVHAFGGQSAAGARYGYRQQRVSQLRAGDCGVWLPLWQLAEMEALSIGQPGHPHLTRLLARRAGYVLVARAEAGESDGADLMHGLAQINAEMGDVARCLAEALADGVLTRTERRQVLEELAHVEQRVAALRQMIGGTEG